MFDWSPLGDLVYLLVENIENFPNKIRIQLTKDSVWKCFDWVELVLWFKLVLIPTLTKLQSAPDISIFIFITHSLSNTQNTSANILLISNCLIQTKLKCSIPNYLPQPFLPKRLIMIVIKISQNHTKSPHLTALRNLKPDFSHKSPFSPSLLFKL